MDAGLSIQSGAAEAARNTGVLDTGKIQRLGRDGDVDGAAHEMEKLFATMLVSELRKALPEGLFGSGAGHDTYSGWFDEHIGATLADSGALGLAGQIKASMNQPPPSEG
tara:strand:- start:2966 stop:3292 length:327 start_codon:yes stop_codon:yes gene_type:complete